MTSELVADAGLKPKGVLPRCGEQAVLAVQVGIGDVWRARVEQVRRLDIDQKLPLAHVDGLLVLQPDLPVGTKARVDAALIPAEEVAAITRTARGVLAVVQTLQGTAAVVLEGRAQDPRPGIGGQLPPAL